MTPRNFVCPLPAPEPAPLRIAVAGNPNSGKSTLINSLAGSRLHVGNWPGVTVEKKEAAFEHGIGPCCGHCRGKGREGSAVRLEDMGIRPGKEVEMLNNRGGGALLVKVDDSRIAVGRGMAMKIMVRRRER